jgi:hypothetical protein
MRKYNIYDIFEHIEVNSIKGSKLKKLYNLDKVPVILIFNNEVLINKLVNITKKDIEKLRDTIN